MPDAGRGKGRGSRQGAKNRPEWRFAIHALKA